MNRSLPLEINGLAVTLKRPVFSKVDLNIEPGKFHTIMVENGCGKTVLVDSLMGYHKFSGQIRYWGLPYDNKNRRQLNTRIGWVLSHHEDYPIGLTVRRLFSMISRLYPRWNRELERRLISQFDLDTAKGLATMSLGEQSKVKLVKALAIDPDLLVLDELTANLSPKSKESILAVLLEIFTDRNLSVLYISHSNEEAIKLSDYVHHLTVDGLVADTRGVNHA